MIILKLPQKEEEMVRYARIEKPKEFSQLESILAKRYNKALSCKYTKMVEEFLYKNIEFPKEGIYYAEAKNGRLMVYSEEENVWKNTMHKIEDYIIDNYNPLWEKFFTKYAFLQKLESEIKETIQQEIRNLLEIKDWKDVTVIDLSTYETFESTADKLIKSILLEYFSDEIANDLYGEIRKNLFPAQCNNFVNLINEGFWKSRFIFGEVNVLKKDASLDNIEKILSEELEKTEIKKIMLRLKECILFDSNKEAYEISYIEKDGFKYVKYNGLELPIYKGEIFFPIHNKNFIQNIKDWLLSFNYEKNGACDMMGVSSEDICKYELSECTLYNILYPISSKVKTNIKVVESIDEISFFVDIYAARFEGNLKGFDKITDLYFYVKKRKVYNLEKVIRKLEELHKYQLFIKISE